MKYKVPFIKPSFPAAADVAADYTNILASNWFTNFGPNERAFAKQVAAEVGDDYYAATFSSATAGLMAAVLAILGKGDNSQYVLMPSFTFAAGADILQFCGYQPVFVDIEPEGLHMDVAAAQTILAEPKLKGRVAGILFCNAFGVGSKHIEEWESLSKETGLPLIIDSAAGFGSRYSTERKVGAAGACEVYSFHATKPFAIGEGGAVVSRDKGLIEKLLSIQNFGFENGAATRAGFNGKLQEINAAIGLRQLKKFETVLADRRQVFERYQSELDKQHFSFQANAEQASLCFAVVAAKDATRRDTYHQALLAAGVEAKTYYAPLHQQPYFNQVARPLPLARTEAVASAVLSLPIHDTMHSDDLALVIDTLNGAI